jgi:D-glycero-D-manno-heptose 1,7-bisphosphate phosphatase
MKHKGLLLDRDGVVNRDTGYVGRREDFVFMPGLFPLLRTMRDRGYRIAIVTNQSGVARGYFSAEDYHTLTDWMLGELGRENIVIDLVLASFEHPEAEVVAHRRGSYWRKPNPGMIMEAALRLDLDLPRSIMIGDSPRDMVAAQAAGVGQYYLLGEAATKDAATYRRLTSLSQLVPMLPSG